MLTSLSKVTLRAHSEPGENFQLPELSERRVTSATANKHSPFPSKTPSRRDTTLMRKNTLRQATLTTWDHINGSDHLNEGRLWWKWAPWCQKPHWWETTLMEGTTMMRDHCDPRLVYQATDLDRKLVQIKNIYVLSSMLQFDSNNTFTLKVSCY